VSDPAWILEHLELFRLALFLCCFGYWALAHYWLRPRAPEVRAAIMAVWVQLALGTVLDTQIVRRGGWVYRPMAFTLGGVPLDLHIDWGLTWGFLMVWVYTRRRDAATRSAGKGNGSAGSGRRGMGTRPQGRGSILLYLSVWTSGTLAVDAVIGPHLPFLTYASPQWWIADAGLLLVVGGATLWVYHAILYPPQQPASTVWSCRMRSLLYVGSLAGLFYGYLPGVVLSLTDGWDARPLFWLDDWRVLSVALAPPLLLGSWATVVFTDVGQGTPLPLDPPRRLVTTGPYAFVRNPMQIAGLMLATLLVLYHPTRFMLLYAMDMGLVSAVLFHLHERCAL
jgi:hypothetical protein